MSIDDEWQSSGLAGKVIAGNILVASNPSPGRGVVTYTAQHLERGMPLTLAIVSGGSERLRQAEKLRAIRHAGLTEIVVVGTLDNGELYIAMETPTDPTLRELAAGKAVAPRRALSIARQLLEALEAIHAAGAVHGDVHPGVIYVAPATGEDLVKLAQVGIAPLAGTDMSEPDYSAPETASGPGDARADLYAVGAVLYELLTGRPPFTASDHEALRRLHAYGPLQTLRQRAPDLAPNDELEAIVGTALAKQADGRYRSARDMIDAIDKALPTLAEPIDQEPPPPPAPPTDDSLWLHAKDLMPAKSAPVDAPIVPQNISRTVPKLPLHERVYVVANRWLDRASARLRLPRRVVLATLGVAGLALVVAIVTCGDPDTRKPKPADTKPALPPAERIAARCDQLGKTCGDTEKHKSKIVADCKHDISRQVERKCTDAAVLAYECYETKLCGKADKVWALTDLGVLASRRSTCIKERDALRACAGP